MISHINAIVLGHVITYLAIFLNYSKDEDLGIAFGVLGLVFCYYYIGLYTSGTNRPWLAPIFYWSSSLCVALSYLIWVIS